MSLSIQGKYIYIQYSIMKTWSLCF